MTGWLATVNVEYWMDFSSELIKVKLSLINWLWNPIIRVAIPTFLARQYNHMFWHWWCLDPILYYALRDITFVLISLNWTKGTSRLAIGDSNALWEYLFLVASQRALLDSGPLLKNLFPDPSSLSLTGADSGTGREGRSGGVVSKACSPAGSSSGFTTPQPYRPLTPTTALTSCCFCILPLLFYVKYLSILKVVNFLVFNPYIALADSFLLCYITCI